jgi:hypothetical protein
MSLFPRSGVFTKYALTFPGLQNLKISNDPTFGQYALQADVDVKMGYGSLGTTFTITIYDLPNTKQNNLLRQLQIAIGGKAVGPKSVKIELGYFETSTSQVINGVIDKVTAAAGKSPNDGRLLTTLTGEEAAFWACSKVQFRNSVSSSNKTFLDVANDVLAEVFTPCSQQTYPGIDKLVAHKVQVADNPGVKPDATKPDPPTTSMSFAKGSTVLSALAAVAYRAKQRELLLIDGNVYFGRRIALPNKPTATLDPSINLAAYDEQIKTAPWLDAEAIAGALTKGAATAGLPAVAAFVGEVAEAVVGEVEAVAEAIVGPNVSVQGYNFTALGDPTLRPGQAVSVSNNVGTFPPSTEFVIGSVEHQFDSTKGYTCIGVGVQVQKDGSPGPAIASVVKASADTAAQAVAGQVKAAATASPAVEVVEVMQKGADAYKADLFHSDLDQNDPELQPSIHTAIKQDGKQVYENKPIASPFAWRKCGLVTPYYPGMKALVAHNGGLASDLIVTGYIWSDKPDTPPPSSQEGDWWLCLPVDLKDAPPPKPPDKPPKPCDPAPTQQKTPFKAPPDDDTKAANDLTSAAGLRVIEAKGLRITVGASKLGTVGNRPTDATADELLIEHSSGTTLHIDSQGALSITPKGAMTIDASNSSLSIKGDVTIQGTLEIK